MPRPFTALSHTVANLRIDVDFLKKKLQGRATATDNLMVAQMKLDVQRLADQFRDIGMYNVHFAFSTVRVYVRP